jgi:hypothetical protein
LNSIYFVILSFLSTLGDTLFLAGVPLFFYSSAQSNAMIGTAYLPVIITLSIFAAKRFITKSNQRDPVKLTAWCEIAMGIIELIILGIFLLSESKSVILFGIIPLAFIYNIYAPSKFFKLQSIFFQKNVFYWTTWQSAMNRLGVLTGVALSGYILVNHGIKSILIVDALTFLFYGSALLALGKLVKTQNLRDDEKQEPSKLVTDLPQFSKIQINYFMVLISLSTLFLVWERSSIVAITDQLNIFTIDTGSYYRAILGFAGVGTGLLVSKYLLNKAINIWITVLTSIFVFSSLGTLLGLEVIICIMFYLGGILATLSLPVQRHLYHSIKENGGDDSFVMTNHWVYNALISLSLFPINFISSDSVAISVGTSNTFAFTVISILGFGAIGGYIVLKKMRLKY